MIIKVSADELHFGSASSIQQKSFFSYSLKQGQSSYKCTSLIKITKMTVVFQSGGSVTIDDHQGMFALHYACQGGGLQCVQILMHFGAALNPKNKVRWKFDFSPTLRRVLQLRISCPQWAVFNGVKGQTSVIVQSDPSISIKGSLLLGQR